MIPVTVIIPTSPRPSHPSPRIIRDTVVSISQHFPECPMLITCDGPESDERYRAFQENLQYLIAGGLHRGLGMTSTPYHLHQSGLIGPTLECVHTPLLLYVEDDWEILPNIEWQVLADAILSGQFNYIKLHAAPRIHPLHEEKMGEHVRLSDETFVRRTRQWSQNPHLASTEFYRRINDLYLKGKTDYIENIMVGHESFEHRLGILNPCTGDMMRCRHLDGDQP